jgi:hypothetical protein
VKLAAGDWVRYVGPVEGWRDRVFTVVTAGPAGATAASLALGVVACRLVAEDVEMVMTGVERGQRRRARGESGPFWWER